MTEEPDRTNYGEGSLTTYGYIAEWRLKPESALLGTLLSHSDVGSEWKQAPYIVSKLARLGPDASRLVRPYLPEYDFGKSEHGLIDILAAQAVIACLKTSLRDNLLEHIEWRIVLVKLTASHKMTRADDDDDVKAAERATEIEGILTGTR